MDTSTKEEDQMWGWPSNQHPDQNTCNHTSVSYGSNGVGHCRDCGLEQGYSASHDTEKEERERAAEEFNRRERERRAKL